MWTAWDGRWYLGIAAHGYVWGMQGKPSVAFFPLYPSIVHAIRALGFPAVPVGMLVSNLAFLGALFYVHALARSEWGSRAAGHAVILLTFFPTAFVTAAPYSESLFLLSAAGALFHARRRETAQAGIFVALAILTRSTGIILVPAVVVASGGVRPLRWISLLAPSLVGMAVYGEYLRHFHIPLSALLHAQRAWHRTLTYPWSGFTSSFHWLAFHGSSNLAWAAENLLGLVVTVGFLALTYAARRDLSPATLVYCACFWALVLCSPECLDGYYAPFSSMDRFVLALFPLAPWVALRLDDLQFQRLRLALLTGFLLATGFLFGGGWVG